MPQYTEGVTLITLKFEIDQTKKIPFAKWQARCNEAIIAFPDFISLEFASPYNAHKEWLVVQSLASRQAAMSWRESDPYATLLDELHSLATDGHIQEIFDSESSVHEGVTQVIIAKVNPDKEHEYRQWSAKIHHLEATFEGFRGVYIQSPNKNKEGHWITLLQFDTREHLDKWLESPVRQKLLQESLTLTSSLEVHRIISPYSGWFASIAKVAELPPVWKQTMIVLLVLFPIVMLELKFLSAITQGWNSSLATFLGNAISVTLISFPMMPIAIWFLSWWLVPHQRPQWKQTALGTLVVMALYLIEIVLFWNFL